MSDDASGTAEHRPAPWLSWTTGGVAIAMLMGALAVFIMQVEVTDSSTEATRACGSAFDAAIDRSGWRAWWAQDLDEPDSAVRDALLRTTECPDAVNARIVVAAALAIVAGLLGLVAATVARPDEQPPVPAGATTRRLDRIATITVWIGSAMTLAGLVAVTVLVADADSTLFLYTDRLVVAMVGLVVLIPAIALAVGGLVLHVLSRHLVESDDERP